MKTWAEMKVEELEQISRESWTIEDYEAYNYCMECFAEDERDAEYLDCWGVII